MEPYNEGEYYSRRVDLVEQLYHKGITNKKVLEAIGSVPREIFLPDELKDKAYEDSALPITHEQTISQPYTVAYMTSLLEPSEGDRILEIGTGSGYQASILAETGVKVYSIERIPELLGYAEDRFSKLNYEIITKNDDGTLGWQEFAPFDGIIVTAAAPQIPMELVHQLKVNGRLVVPIGDRKSQTMHLIIKVTENKYKDYRKDTFKFVPLIGKKGWSEK